MSGFNMIHLVLFLCGKKAVERSNTKWNLLIRSNEVVSGRLKKNIEKKLLQPRSTPIFFLPQSKNIFLRKVLKYPLSWSGEPLSGLLYDAGSKLDLISFKKESIEGELICHKRFICNYSSY